VKGPFRDEAILGELERVVAKFRGAGANIREISLPKALEQCGDACRKIEQVEAAAFHAPRFDMHKDRYGPMVRELIEEGFKRTGIEYMDAIRRRVQAKHDVRNCFDDVDALLTPVNVPAPRVGDREKEANFWIPWSFVGMPALSLPTGLSEDNLPLAVQIVAAPFAEAQLLAIGRWCETVLAFSEGPA
jgi:Asp-tRNA(Asn)/Glu-tRNA(Gln) amidotransferase A subunit family amidase